MKTQYLKYTPFLLVEKFPEDVFITLADKLPRHWKKFARYLLIDDSAIDNVIEEFETTREQTFQLLNEWRRDNPLKTWRDMKKGLVFCKREDLVIEIERSRVYELHKILKLKIVFLSKRYLTLFLGNIRF